MDESQVSDLRAELKNLGYLSRGLERWFALDPWRSRAFWSELLLLTAKSAVILALFVAAPMLAAMSLRNRPLPPLEALALGALYLVTGAVVAGLVLLACAAILKWRPDLAIDSPTALLAISLALGGVLTSCVAFWWMGFPSPPARLELGVVLLLLLLLFVTATVVYSAAILSFSIYELKRIPKLHQRARGGPISFAGVLLLCVVAGTVQARGRSVLSPPSQVVITPTTTRLSLIAVDGLTWEVLAARPNVSSVFATKSMLSPLAAGSAPERWATLGTGVSPELHHVRSIEGVRLRGTDHVIQSASRFDIALWLAHLTRLATRQPLPPTVRRRAYAWELLAGRGVPVASINWWADASGATQAMKTLGQESVYAAARASGPRSAEELALSVDAAALRLFAQERDARLKTVYLPALDVILNRLTLDPTARLTASVRALDALGSAVAAARAEGAEVILVGLPGDEQEGHGVLASSLPLAEAASALDLAPTICALFGFPASEEMLGRALVPAAAERISTYGTREPTTSTVVDEEYYQNLRSLGYVQ